MTSKSPSSKTLGPVADLERHLPSDWTRALLDAVYDPDATPALERVLRFFDPAEKRLLDLCCGAGARALELARRGFQVTGIERSSYLVRKAQSRAQQEGLALELEDADVRHCTLRPAFYDGALLLDSAFLLFSPAEAARVLGSVHAALRPGSTLVMEFPAGDVLRASFEPRSWEWLDAEQFVCRERSLASDGSQLVNREVIVHAEKGVIVDQFYGQRLHSREGVERLLEAAGFAAIEVEPSGSTELWSARAQERESGPLPVRWREVTVLLGDASLPDETKRGGLFNPDDVELVDKLKAALSELSDFRFTYVARHANLLGHLRTVKPEFVLNFCDEGFQNAPTMELHVPAFLEMLAIPYSGAGPACLATCYNKHITRAVAADLDLPVPLETLYTGDHAAVLPAKFPALVKPNEGDGSFGITQHSVVTNTQELIAYLRQFTALHPGRALLIQELLTGPEYTVALIGNPGTPFKVLPIVRPDFSKLDPGLPRICGFESKEVPDNPYWEQIDYPKADLDGATRATLVDYSERLFLRLGCRDYARFDFREDDTGSIKLIDANPNPGYNYLGYLGELDGIPYSRVLGWIVEAAQDRLQGEASRR